MTQTENLNVVAQELLPTPEAVKRALPLSDSGGLFVQHARQTILNILERRDPRLLLVVGPCSLHDVQAGLDYATKLKALAEEVHDSIYVVLRAYFEKPRTTVGWKGLINDPHLNGSFDVSSGIRIARKFLLDVTDMGLPLSTEALDPIVPQYLQDVIAWSAIGARTTESQTHREMASGLSSIVGFKNGTDGQMETALNALESVTHAHRFLGINQNGRVSVIHTRGNPGAHIVLRGGVKGPNFDAAAIRACESALRARDLVTNIMVDCSHANSSKDHAKQALVVRDIAEQIQVGNQSIVGLMLESNLVAGNQPLRDKCDLKYGVSITDACIGWRETETLVHELADSINASLMSRLTEIPAAAS